MPPVSSSTQRFTRPILYALAAGVAGSGLLYYSYRPREIPGSSSPAVPLRFAADGTVAPPRFPKIRSRAEQIAELKRSGNATQQAGKDSSGKGGFGGLVETVGKGAKTEPHVEGGEEYDLLVIGAGATGAGIALDAATRGLKVAVVERDDFSSGTSSKSTKLVHGGVRYLEKAVWELDYNQYVDFDTFHEASEGRADGVADISS